ncbi:hypothetical protein GCM10029992_00090 [Glycomyces albus]
MRRLEALRAVPVTARGSAGRGALALVLSGWRWGYPELVAVGAAAALACVAAVSVIAAKPNLEVEREVAPDRVSAGEEGGGPGRAQRREVAVGQRPRRGRLRRRHPGDPPGRRPLARLRPGKSTRAGYSIATERRGVIDVGPLGIGKRDILGLAATAGSFGPVSRLWVHPRLWTLARTPDGLARSSKAPPTRSNRAR